MVNEESYLEERRAHLAWLHENEQGMLAELATAIGSKSPSLFVDDPDAALSEVASFVERTDFRDATDDARIWLVMRLGLYIARLLIIRHGGDLRVEDHHASRFLGRFVVTGMQPPVSPSAIIAPFEMANDVVCATVKLSLTELIEVAEEELQLLGSDQSLRGKGNRSV